METMGKIIQVIILMESISVGLDSPINCPPCHCTETVMQCTGSNTTYIPRPLNSVRAVSLTSYIFTVEAWRLVNLTTDNINITSLEIESCVIQNFSDNAFISLTTLKHVTIKNCTVSMEDLREGIQGLGALRQFRILAIHELPLHEIPANFFDEMKTSALQTLELVGTELTSDNVFSNNASGGSIFSGLKQLKRLHLVNNRLDKIPNNAFSDMVSLEVLHLGNNTIRHIGDSAFNLSTLLQLFLHNNGFDFSSSDVGQMFGHAPKLQLLDLSKNDLGHLGGPSLGHMFSSSLAQLHTLLLEGTRITHLPSDIFKNLSNLRILGLENNSITHWSPEIFEELYKLETLRLSHNQISLINRTSLSENLIKRLKSVDFSFNPFSCSCDLVWFRHWLNETKVKLLQFPSGYKCHSPQELSGRLLIIWTPSQSECKKSNDVTGGHSDAALIIGAVVAGLACVAVIIILVVYREQIRGKLRNITPKLNVYYQMHPEN